MKALSGKGRAALVTGARRGIGLGIAKALLAEGYAVLLCGVTEEPRATADIAPELTRLGTWAYLRCDVSNAQDREALFAGMQEKFGRLDVLVNNAGVFSYLDILATPVERIERMILLHALTRSKNCRAFRAAMARRGSGYILNMSSYSVWMPFPGMALYTATKAYVRCFSKAFAKEVAERGVRVTAVCPAGVATDLYGLSPKWQHIGRRLGVLISPDSCARRGLRALWRGRRCIVPDWWNRLFVPLFFYMPDFVTRRIRRFTIRFQR